MAGRPWREECGGKKWRESAAGGEMAGERDLSAYGKLIGTISLRYVDRTYQLAAS